MIKERWACLALSQRYYLPEAEIKEKKIHIQGQDDRL
jgi:hypothetical protein